jgi:hypothetical protein
MSIDLTQFRPITELHMTDKMAVKRVVPPQENEYGQVVSGGSKMIYENVKCRVSQMNQNFNNPNAESEHNIPVLYMLKVFAPHNIVIKAVDLITLIRTVDGVEKTYVDKKASEYMFMTTI